MDLGGLLGSHGVNAVLKILDLGLHLLGDNFPYLHIIQVKFEILGQGIFACALQGTLI